MFTRCLNNEIIYFYRSPKIIGQSFEGSSSGISHQTSKTSSSTLKGQPHFGTKSNETIDRLASQRKHF